MSVTNSEIVKDWLMYPKVYCKNKANKGKTLFFLAITHGTDQSLTDKEITLNSYVKCVRLDILY